MIQKIKDLLAQSEFLKNVSTLATGTAVAQGLSFLTAPILYRMYGQEDYGLVGIFMSLVGIIGIFSAMTFLRAIMLEKDEDAAVKVLWLNRVVNISGTLIVAFAIVLFGDHITSGLNAPEMKFWLYFVPVSIFFTGQNAILRTWANRRKYYKLLSVNSVLIALTVPLISIVSHFIFPNETGLFIGLIVGQIIPVLVMHGYVKAKDNISVDYLNLHSLVYYFKKYINFLKFSLPSDFINVLAAQMPVFMLSRYSGVGAVGIYSLAVKVLELPISLVANSVGDAFMQRATEDYHREGNCRRIFNSVAKNLFRFSIIPFLLFLWLAPDIYPLVFGEKWIEAGHYARPLSILYWCNFIVGVLSFVYFIRERQKEDFLLRIPMIVFMYFAMYYGLKESEIMGLLGLSVVRSIFYFIVFIRVFSLSKGNNADCSHRKFA